MDVVLLVLMSIFAAGGHAQQCEPGFADSCFSGVESDLTYMLNINEGLAANLSYSATHELCLAMDDALNCTSDVIDSDCSGSEGRDLFDSWLSAIRASQRYVCDSNHQKMIDILQKIRCWNVNDFLVCTRESANLEHVRDLMHAELDDEECRGLRSVFEVCYKMAQVGSCREQEGIQQEFQGLTSAFFNASPCRHRYHKNLASNTSSSLLDATSMAVFAIFLASRLP